MNVEVEVIRKMRIKNASIVDISLERHKNTITFKYIHPMTGMEVIKWAFYPPMFKDRFEEAFDNDKPINICIHRTRGPDGKHGKAIIKDIIHSTWF